MLGVDLASLYTISGALTVGAAVLHYLNRSLAGAVLLIMAGAGGSAVAWDRWSARTGEQVHLTAFLNITGPSPDEVAMLVTHVPLLALGLVALALLRRAELQ